ncbi:hypothetical protein FZC66_13130 [Priestia megaterium]|nr:hypothetical protein FZC66_13130 [Priestia megaterium]
MKSLNKIFIVSASLAFLLAACGNNEESTKTASSSEQSQQEEKQTEQEEQQKTDKEESSKSEEVDSNESVENQEDKTEESGETKETADTSKDENQEESTIVKEEKTETSKEDETNTDQTNKENSSKEDTTEKEPSDQTASLTKSDGQDYAIEVLEGYELAGEEPGRDMLILSEDDSQFMRIELVSSELSMKEAETTVKQTAMAVNQNAAKKENVPTSGKFANAVWYETQSGEANVQVILTTGEKPVKLTIFTKSSENLDEFLRMAGTIQ